MTTSRGFRWLVIVWLLAKLALAAWVPPFGDEVFYWQESRHLAWGYSDLPPLTAWLVRLGTALCGDHVFGLRFAFVACGVATVALLLRWARDRGVGVNSAAGAVFALPLLVWMGQLATPDAPLTLAVVVAAWALDRALRDDRRRDWGLFGVALAVAWLTHWRAVALYPAGLLLLLWHGRALQAARQAPFWWAQGIGLLGLLPSLIFNAAHDWSALRFQAVERHGWAFHPSALLQPLEQAATMGGLMYGLLLWAMMRAWRRRADARDAVVSATSLGIAGFYLLAGLFADAERTRFHWPLPAYLPLLVALPEWIAASPGVARFARWARVAGWVASVVLAVALVGLRVATSAVWPDAVRRQVDPFMGWDVAAATTRAHLDALPPDAAIVADNFLLAAQLDFALGGARTVYVLDHPRNVKHGRQAQLAIWRRDARALAADAPAHVLVVVEEQTVGGAAALPFYRALCRDVAAVRYRDDRRLVGGKRFVWLTAVRGAGGDCRIAPIGRIDAPRDGQRVLRAEGFDLSGWVIREPQGIDGFAVWVDGREDAALSAAYGSLATHVRDLWPDVQDAHWPNVGFFRAGVGRDWAPGTHHIVVRVRADGVWRDIDERRVVITDAS